jgi:hypothetical protein
VFWCYIFGVNVGACDFFLFCSKVAIDSFVCIACIGDGDMEASSKCACAVFICID